MESPEQGRRAQCDNKMTAVMHTVKERCKKTTCFYCKDDLKDANRHKNKYKKKPGHCSLITHSCYLQQFWVSCQCGAFASAQLLFCDVFMLSLFVSHEQEDQDKHRTSPEFRLLVASDPSHDQHLTAAAGDAITTTLRSCSDLPPPPPLTVLM